MSASKAEWLWQDAEELSSGPEKATEKKIKLLPPQMSPRSSSCTGRVFGATFCYLSTLQANMNISYPSSFVKKIIHPEEDPSESCDFPQFAEMRGKQLVLYE